MFYTVTEMLIHQALWVAHNVSVDTQHYNLTKLRCQHFRIFWDKNNTDISTHWGQVTHICVSQLGHQWFIWCLIASPAPCHYMNQCWFNVSWTTGNNFQWISNQIQQFPFKKMRLKMSSGKCWSFCLNLNVLTIRTALAGLALNCDFW